MSRYLIDRIRRLDNVDIQVRSEVVELHGDETAGLDGATVRHRDSGITTFLPVRHVFMFIGAEPNTAWLDGCLALDDKGFVKTGSDLTTGDLTTAKWPLVRRPFIFETSLPGVFAVGDVRGNSIKRVASAVGEGSVAISFVHQFLAQ